MRKQCAGANTAKKGQLTRRELLYRGLIAVLAVFLVLALVAVILDQLGILPAFGVDHGLSGVYSCVAADTGDVYTFHPSGKVRVQLFFGGTPAIDYTGTYRLDEKKGEITFDFPEDREKFYTGTFSFSSEEDGKKLIIDGVTFTADPAVK